VWQLGEQDASLQRVEASIRTQKSMLMPLETTMSANRLHPAGKIVVISEQCSAVAVTADRFCRKKAGAADVVTRNYAGPVTGAPSSPPASLSRQPVRAAMH
jgi:hypothetical protein